MSLIIAFCHAVCYPIGACSAAVAFVAPCLRRPKPLSFSQLAAPIRHVLRQALCRSANRRASAHAWRSSWARTPILLLFGAVSLLIVKHAVPHGWHPHSRTQPLTVPPCAVPFRKRCVGSIGSAAQRPSEFVVDPPRLSRSRAHAKSHEQLSFRHSSRSRSLKRSAYACCTGLSSKLLDLSGGSCSMPPRWQLADHARKGPLWSRSFAHRRPRRDVPFPHGGPKRARQRMTLNEPRSDY